MFAKIDSKGAESKFARECHSTIYKSIKRDRNILFGTKDVLKETRDSIKLVLESSRAKRHIQIQTPPLMYWVYYLALDLCGLLIV